MSDPKKYAVDLTLDELGDIASALDFFYEEAGAPETTKALAKRFNDLGHEAEQSENAPPLCSECLGLEVILFMPDENDESKDYEIPCPTCKSKQSENKG